MQKVYKKYHINMSIRYKNHNTFYIDFYPDAKVTFQFLIGTVLHSSTTETKKISGMSVNSL